MPVLLLPIARAVNNRVRQIMQRNRRVRFGAIRADVAAAPSYPTVANSRLWLDRNRNLYSDTGGTTPAVVNDSVASWRSVGGGWGTTLVTQATSSKRPVLKSDGLQSDGVDDKLDCSLLINGDYTIYFVVSKPNNAVSCGMADYTIYGYFGGGGNLFCSNGASWSNATNWDGTTTPIIVRFRSGGGNLYSKAPNFVEQTYVVAAANATMLSIFTANGGNASHSGCRFMQMVLVDRNLTPGGVDDLAIIAKLQELEVGVAGP